MVKALVLVAMMEVDDDAGDDDGGVADGGGDDGGDEEMVKRGKEGPRGAVVVGGASSMCDLNINWIHVGQCGEASHGFRRLCALGYCSRAGFLFFFSFSFLFLPFFRFVYLLASYTSHR